MNNSINYVKRKNEALFKKMEDIGITQSQNYIPIYTQFFHLNENNYNSINLENEMFLDNLKMSKNKNKDKNKDKDNVNKDDITNTNTYSGVIKHTNSSSSVKPVFMKFAPLLDPFKYFLGKYNYEDEHLFNLPKLKNENNIHPKLLDPNNSSYVDTFFVYLTNKLLQMGFVHGLEFYGSFLSIKENFKINVIDDFEYLLKSKFFNDNKDKLFTIDDYSHLLSNNDKLILKPINILNTSNKSALSIKSLDNNIYEDVFEVSETSVLASSNDDVVDENKHITLNDMKLMDLEIVDITINDYQINMNNEVDEKLETLNTDSSDDECSSRTSHTNDNNDNNNDNDNENNDNENNNGNKSLQDNASKDINGSLKSSGSSGSSGSLSGSSTDYSSIMEETLWATIPKFPVQVICMEKCENTLDSLIINDELSDEELTAAFTQVIMILATYQKVFSMTHNDLHTNNVMYIPTGKMFLYYKLNNVCYKVPTYGKIFKIIDFGRAIYKFNGKLMCSDSFKQEEDAGGQYNMEPYFNKNKPRLEPNFSFDLCRLGCSIFDYLVEELDDIKELSKCDPNTRLIVEWCLDDNNNNILYKTNGDERYPDFKLYKMIARLVHNQVPIAQLSKPIFKPYIVNRKSLSKDVVIMDIDEYPIFV